MINSNPATRENISPNIHFNYGHAAELFTASAIAAKSIVGASDKRLKDIEEPLGDGWLERLRKLDVVTYRWKESGKADVGIIAQVGSWCSCLIRKQEVQQQQKAHKQIRKQELV